jgi:hypothetical protein
MARWDFQVALGNLSANGLRMARPGDDSEARGRRDGACVYFHSDATALELKLGLRVGTPRGPAPCSGDITQPAQGPGATQKFAGNFARGRGIPDGNRGPGTVTGVHPRSH